MPASRLKKLPAPFLVLLAPVVREPHLSACAENPENIASPDTQVPARRFALVLRPEAERVAFFEQGSTSHTILPFAEFALRYGGLVLQATPKTAPLADPDTPAAATAAFGLRWFIPELLKHKRIFRDVLIASLAIQLMALATPLFTRAVIDKVVVHHTLNTLTVIGIGLGVFMAFSAAMTWVPQYLVLHTGNRIDAVLVAILLNVNADSART